MGWEMKFKVRNCPGVLSSIIIIVIKEKGPKPVCIETDGK